MVITKKRMNITAKGIRKLTISSCSLWGASPASSAGARLVSSISAMGSASAAAAAPEPARFSRRTASSWSEPVMPARGERCSVTNSTRPVSRKSAGTR